MRIMWGAELDRDHDVGSAKNQPVSSIDPNIGPDLLIGRYSQGEDQGTDNDDEEILTTLENQIFIVKFKETGSKNDKRFIS